MIRSSRIVILTAVIAVVAVALVGAVAFAQGPGFGGPRGRAGGPGGPGLPFRELNLTDAQQQQVRQLMEQFRVQNRTLIEQVGKAEDARHDAVEAIPFDEGRVRTAMQQLAEVQTELAVHQARLQNDVYNVLTPEQQQQAQKLRAERQARVRERQERLQQRLQQRGARPQA